MGLKCLCTRNPNLFFLDKKGRRGKKTWAQKIHIKMHLKKTKGNNWGIPKKEEDMNVLKKERKYTFCLSSCPWMFSFVPWRLKDAKRASPSSSHLLISFTPESTASSCVMIWRKRGKNMRDWYIYILTYLGIPKNNVHKRRGSFSQFGKY